VRKGPLQIQIPDLHVAQAVIRVDREIIRHRATGRSRKSVDECQVTGCGMLTDWFALSRTAAETQNSELPFRIARDCN